jgi:hypothetical protein
MMGDILLRPLEQPGDLGLGQPDRLVVDPHVDPQAIVRGDELHLVRG